MANRFGVTPGLVRSTYFGHLGGDFGPETVPALSVVQQEIERKAARLEGRLLQEGVEGAALTNTTSTAYLVAQDLLLLDVAITVLGGMPGAADMVAVLERRLSNRYKDLETEGWQSLGATEPEADPQGIFSHLDGLGGMDVETREVLRHDDVL